MQPAFQTFVYLSLFVAAGFAFLALICFLNSLLSGWHLLASRFCAQSEPYDQTLSAGPYFYTVYMRFWTHYSNIITLIAVEDALYLSVMFSFRVGHPPLRIPWNEIEFSQTRRFWWRYAVLTLGEEEKIPMRISMRLARKLGILDRFPKESRLSAEP
jgi:hypothetical protein